MQSALAPKLRSVIADHLAEASPAELAQVVGALAGNGQAGIIEFPPVHIEASYAWRQTGLQKLGEDGREILDPQDGEHVAVRDRATGLIWSRETLGEFNFADAQKACADCRLMGFSDWRLPTVRELLTIVDYTRVDPAIDTEYFDCKSSYYWTSTPWARKPAGAAWFVYFNYGSSSWYTLDSEFFVRAVRSGQ